MEMGKLAIGIEVNSKNFDKQIEKVQKRLKELNNAYEIEKKEDPFYRDTALLEEYETEIEKTTNKLIQLQKQQQKVSLSKVKNIEFNPLKSGTYSLQTNQIGKSMEGFNSNQLKYTATDFNDFKKGIEEVDKETNDFTNKSKSRFEGLGKVVKKVGLRILGLSTIYGIVSRASSAYLSQDTELAKKLQSVWVGLGSFLAPVLELMANVMAKAVGYLNVFITALTGTDYIANANAKALNKQAKAQAGLNKAVERYSYDFDVIRKQDSQNNGGVGGLGDIDTSGFQMPELDEKVVKKLQNLAKWLKENKDLIEQVGTVLGITFGALAIANLLKNIGLLIGSGGAGIATGLAGLAWLLGIIAVVWLGKIIIDGLVRQAEELNKQLDDNIVKASGNADKTRELANQFKNLALSEEEAGENTKKATNYYNQQSKTLTEHIKRLEKDKNIIGAVTGANSKLHSEQLTLLGSLEAVVNNYYSLYQHGKLNEGQTKEFINVLKKEREVMQLLGKDTKDVDKIIEDVSKKEHTIKVEATVEDHVSGGLQGIINRFMNSRISLIADVHYSGSDILHGGGGRAFAAGGIVTQPTRALIGEAGYPEAVVPMTQDYLATLAGAIAQAGGTGSSGVVNVYLDGRLIQKQVDSRQQQDNFARNM